MFGVSKEYVDKKHKEAMAEAGNAVRTALHAIGAVDGPKIKAIEEKLEDIKFYKEQLERECLDRNRQEQESIEWSRKNMRLECLRMATQSMMGHRSEQVLAHASSLMEFIETGKAPEPAVAVSEPTPKTKGK